VRKWTLAFLPVVLASALAPADEVRTFEQNGQTITETTRMVRRFVPERHEEDRETTVYRRQETTEYRECNRTVWTPVTEYRRQARWHGRWNPFVQPYLVDHMVPYTRWEQRTEVVQVPTARVAYVPEKRIDRVTVVRNKMIEEPVVVSRVITNRTGNDPFNSNAPAVADRTRTIGGVARMESDPPRRAADDTWRASTVRR
jgi:hypothetical protein